MAAACAQNAGAAQCQGFSRLSPLGRRCSSGSRVFLSQRGSRLKAVALAHAVVQERSRLESMRSSSSLQQRTLDFVKYHGLGNDFILVDNRDSSAPKVSPEDAIKLCDRNFGVGGDGVIFAMPGTQGCDYSMRIYNSDGSEPEMCGNGIRCMARFVARLEGTLEPRSYKIHTLAGTIIPELRPDGQVAVDMGPPTLKGAEVPTKLPVNADGAVVKQPLVVDGRTWLVTCVSMGNPHCVTFGEQDAKGDLEVNKLPLEKIGPLFEHHEVFPARTNTEFIQVLSDTHLRMRVWERGAGPTLACGTGACAVVVAAVLEGRAQRRCVVDLPGGPLEIEWKEANNHVYMTGPAKPVFSGIAYLD
ncbi:uncharacterized protein LOC9662619 [Selaginella moellendorffii]|uniref:uncharacterized protein LOC9662619 n=1 Tax=Selaginella moellendorffii TaxID=88036 RepID=UPI000D1CDB38|nr:uncharacterized protein LOC9662619 [Selaginella moellendorffii]XP_024520169.1 uncharacterized protein LOC9662619 [Selaginella moellendorffii]|eukprot:XP_024520168.1 uncharacterized protein LOC9662619 [Selaginella moellendorffii]